MKFGLVVSHNLYLLATLVNSIAHGSINSSRIVISRSVHVALSLHVLSTLHQGSDVEACHSDGQQTHRSEYRETATHVVWDDETLVAFLVSCGTSSTLLGVSNSHNHLLCHFLATLVLTHLLQQTERNSRLCCRS